MIDAAHRMDEAMAERIDGPDSHVRKGGPGCQNEGGTGQCR
jgi:hypothetical protein